MQFPVGISAVLIAVASTVSQSNAGEAFYGYRTPATASPGWHDPARYFNPYLYGDQPRYGFNRPVKSQQASVHHRGYYGDGILWGSWLTD